MAKELFSCFEYAVGVDIASKSEREVKVFFLYNDIHPVTLSLHLMKKKDESERYYLNEAKKIVNTMIKNGSLKKHSIKYNKGKKIRKLMYCVGAPLLAAMVISAITIPVVLSSGSHYNDNCPYLTFNAEKDSTVSYVVKKGSPNIHLQYSNDQENWQDWGANNNISLKEGEKVYIQNTADHLNSKNNQISFSMLGQIAASGDISSLTHVDTMQDYEYYGLFNGCHCLTRAPKLPAVTLTDYCYANMFVECYNLTKAPKLPATTLAEHCYESMFNGCVELKTAPSLPATTLTESCYNNMFAYCFELETAPKLPAMTLAESCYASMFSNCVRLMKAPALPALELADSCYRGMFNTCISITKMPNLPATTLAEHCYRDMFAYCAGLKEIPDLIATTLAESCYEKMFIYCINLVKVPKVLPATTLSYSCYYSMFGNCYSLEIAPELPATNLDPDLHYCYGCMFENCYSLRMLKVAIDTTGASSWLDDPAYFTGSWLANAGTHAGSTPTFIWKGSTTPFPSRNEDTVPDYWTIETY